MHSLIFRRSRKITMSDSQTKILQIVNIVGFIVVIVVNGLANTLPLNGVNTGELSDSFPNLFTPAGYVFGIWGVIYLLLAAYTVFQGLPGNRGREFNKRIGWWFALSCLFNTVWIFMWHYGYVLLSVVVMFMLLGSLIMIYLRLDIGGAEVPPDERRYVHLPFSVYLGWITVAPIANVAALLVDNGWPSEGPTAIAWTVVVIAVAVALSLANAWTRGDVAYSLVLVWALGGIYSKQVNTATVPLVAAAAILVILAGLAYVKLVRKPS